MDDETLTPFVDALSATLVIMVLVSICFTLQNIISVRDSAKLVVDKKIDENNASPILFRPVLDFNIDENYFSYYINFKLSNDQLNQIKEKASKSKEVILRLKSNQNEKKATSNLIIFLQILDLPEEVKVTSSIEKSNLYYSVMEWELK